VESKCLDRLSRVGLAMIVIAAVMLAMVACKTLTSTPLPQTPAQRVAAAEVLFTHTVNIAVELRPKMSDHYREVLDKSFHTANVLLEEAHWYIVSQNEQGAVELIPMIYREIEAAQGILKIYEKKE